MALPRKTTAIGLAALLFLGLMSPVAATAATPATSTTAMADTSAALAAPKVTKKTRVSIEIGWPAYSGAHHYDVRYGTRADLSDAKTVEKYASRTLTGLKNATTYFVQYRAVLGKRGSHTYTGWSQTLKASTLAYNPGQFTSLKAKGGPDSIKVTWNRTKHTTHYSVKVADDLKMTRNVRTFHNIKGTSFTITNVSNGSRSGMPNFIRVYAHNKNLESRDSARLTAYAGAPKVSGKEAVSVASWNLLCAICKGDPGTNPPAWSKRIGTIEKTIKAKKPDVLLLQESTNYKVPDTKSTKSITDLAKRLKKAGYALDRKPEKIGTKHYSNRIAYSTKKFKLVKRGIFALPAARGSNKRGAAWALLKSKKTGKQFYAVSFHVDPNIPLTGKKSKAGTMKRIDTKMKSLNKKNLPILSGGDMNSDYYLLPSNIPHEMMMDLGWTDAASSAKKTDYLYSTFNGFSKMNTSWGRIDYIFTKGVQGTVSYENVLDIDRKGRLKSVPGSDHNMVLAKVKLG